MSNFDLKMGSPSLDKETDEPSLTQAQERQLELTQGKTDLSSINSSIDKHLGNQLSGLPEEKQARLKQGLSEALYAEEGKNPDINWIEYNKDKEALTARIGFLDITFKGDSALLSEQPPPKINTPDLSIENPELGQTIKTDLSQIEVQVDKAVGDLLKDYAPEEQEIIKAALVKESYDVWKDEGSKVEGMVIHPKTGELEARVDNFFYASVDPEQVLNEHRAALEESSIEIAPLALKEEINENIINAPDLEQNQESLKIYTDERYSHYIGEIQEEMQTLNSERNAPDYYDNTPEVDQDTLNERMNALNTQRDELYDIADLPIAEQATRFKELDAIQADQLQEAEITRETEHTKNTESIERNQTIDAEQSVLSDRYDSALEAQEAAAIQKDEETPSLTNYLNGVTPESSGSEKNIDYAPKEKLDELLSMSSEALKVAITEMSDDQYLAFAQGLNNEGIEKLMERLAPTLESATEQMQESMAAVKGSEMRLKELTNDLEQSWNNNIWDAIKGLGKSESSITHIDNNGESVTEVFRNPAASDLGSYLSYLPDGSITDITFFGHGRSSGIEINTKTNEALMSAGDLVMLEGESFINIVQEKLKDQATINLEGCNTARWSNNIARTTSEQLPNTMVKGYRGFGFSNMLFGGNSRVGISKTYKQGEEE